MNPTKWYRDVRVHMYREILNRFGGVSTWRNKMSAGTSEEWAAFILTLSEAMSERFGVIYTPSKIEQQLAFVLQFDQRFLYGLCHTISVGVGPFLYLIVIYITLHVPT